MAVKARSRKNPAAVALGRKGGKKGGLARAAKLTAQERSEIARKAVQARWERVKANRVPAGLKTKTANQPGESQQVHVDKTPDHSDRAVRALLQRIRATDDPKKIRKLADQLERTIFHNQDPAA